MPRRDLQRDVLHELLKVFGADRCFFASAYFYQDPDLGTGVNVRGDHSIAIDFHPGMTRDLDVLTDFGNHRDAVRFEIRFRISSEAFRDVIGESAEHVIPGHEIRLAIDFDQHTEASARSDILRDKTLASFARAFG